MDTHIEYPYLAKDLFLVYILQVSHFVLIDFLAKTLYSNGLPLVSFYKDVYGISSKRFVLA